MRRSPRLVAAAVAPALLGVALLGMAVTAATATDRPSRAGLAVPARCPRRPRPRCRPRQRTRPPRTPRLRRPPTPTPTDAPTSPAPTDPGSATPTPTDTASQAPTPSAEPSASPTPSAEPSPSATPVRPRSRPPSRTRRSPGSACCWPWWRCSPRAPRCGGGGLARGSGARSWRRRSSPSPSPLRRWAPTGAPAPAGFTPMLIALGEAMVDSGFAVAAAQTNLHQIARAHGVTNAEIVVLPTALFITVPGAAARRDRGGRRRGRPAAAGPDRRDLPADRRGGPERLGPRPADRRGQADPVRSPSLRAARAHRGLRGPVRRAGHGPARQRARHRGRRHPRHRGRGAAAVRAAAHHRIQGRAARC